MPPPMIGTERELYEARQRASGYRKGWYEKMKQQDALEALLI
jgi:hypothetical protein